MAPAKSGLAASATANAPRHVIAALLPAQADLGLRTFDALQRQRLVAPSRQPGDLLCQHCRLIEAAGRKAGAGERDRYDNIGVGKQRRPGLGKPAPEQPARVVTVAELEVVHQLTHHPVEAGYRSRPLVVGRIGRSGCGNHGAADVEG